MRKVESCFQRLEQRYALFTPGPARADHFWEMVSPAPADVVRTTLFSTRQQKPKIDPHTEKLTLPPQRSRTEGASQPNLIPDIPFIERHTVALEKQPK